MIENKELNKLSNKELQLKFLMNICMKKSEFNQLMLHHIKNKIMSNVPLSPKEVKIWNEQHRKWYMKNKNYITEDGEITNCAANRAKMNYFEVLIFDFKDYLIHTGGLYHKGFTNFCESIVILLLAIFYPIIYPFEIYITWQRDKRLVDKENKKDL